MHLKFLKTYLLISLFACSSVANWEIVVKPAMRGMGKTIASQVTKQGMNFVDEASQKLLTKGLETLPKHYVFPQTFRQWFANRGINTPQSQYL